MNRMNFKHLALLLLLGSLSFSLGSCTGNSLTSTMSSQTESTMSEILMVSELSHDLLENPAYVRWIGRTSYDESSDYMNFYNTGTGFAISFVGTELKVNISCTHSDSSYQRPYFTVSVDDEVAPEGRVVSLHEPISEVTLVSGLEYGPHTLTFMKRSEPIDSETGINEIWTDGYFTEPSEASSFKVLIVGGSGISGHGNLGYQGQTRTTANSDGLQAFGYLAAASFNADVQFISASGWGLKWGYNISNRNGTVNIRTAFDKIGIGDDEELIDIDYDPLSFIPDFIIVNIGGNDFTSYVLNQTGAELTAAKAEFRSSVTEFVSTMHNLYPSAMILWTHTGSQNGAEAETAIGDLDSKHNYTRIVLIRQVGEGDDPIGADNHASLVTHQKNAEILIAVMNEILGN